MYLGFVWIPSSAYSGPEITVGHRTISDQITISLTKCSNSRKFVRAKIIRSIVKNIFMFVNMMVCFSWCIVCESRVLLARFLSGRGQTLLSKPIQLVYTRNWYIMKNCAISLLQNVWVWVYNVGTLAQETRWQHGSYGFSNCWTFINIITLMTSS